MTMRMFHCLRRLGVVLLAPRSAGIVVARSALTKLASVAIGSVR
jgi:hypothetical protein